METIFQEFLDASNELDELALEGYFGEDVRMATIKRDKIPVDLSLYESLRLWIDGKEQSHDELKKEYIKMFFKIYLNAYKIKPQETINVMTAFFYGPKENPEMEYMSAYSEYARLFTETKNDLSQLAGSQKIPEKKKLGSSLSNTYSKGVEFLGKTLTTLLVLQQIIRDKPYNYYKIYNLTLFEKITKLKNNDIESYNKTIVVINRNLRNAEAHLSLNFNAATNTYLLKKQSKGKIRIESIPLSLMLTEFYPSIGAYAQSFVYSGILFTLAIRDREFFGKAINDIYNNNKI